MSQASLMVWMSMAVALCGLAAGCGAAADTNPDTLKIGAYSVVKEAFHDGLLPAFASEWKRRTGRDARFEESYTASGAQARSIASGLDADIAVLSHPGDMRRLVEARRVKPDWDAGPHKGIISHSLIVIGYRPGNPKGIRDWADLARPGEGVLYPDPKTSGGARWNINAIYGAALLDSKRARGGQPDRATVGDLMSRIQANVVNMNPSGRESVANFERGTGDAPVTYENELLLCRKLGREIPYVVPAATLLIESPAAVVRSSVARHGNRERAEALLAFLQFADGWRVLVEYGFPPIRPQATTADIDFNLPMRAGVFTMTAVGVRVHGPKVTTV